MSGLSLQSSGCMSLMSTVIKDSQAPRSTTPEGPLIMCCSFGVKGDFKACSSFHSALMTVNSPASRHVACQHDSNLNREAMLWFN